jgi:hypothetical protein
MFPKVMAIALLVGISASPPAADDFAGKWEVTKVIEKDKSGFQWSVEIKYPKYMTPELRNGRLAGRYTDQWDYSSEFELVAVVNEGRDLLLVNGGAGTKEPQALSPVHHVKLVKGKLHAVVTSHDKLFEWIAERK